MEGIKKQLTVTHNEQSSIIYRENDAFFTVPRYYGLKKWGHAKECTFMLTQGNEIPSENCFFAATLQENERKQVTATRQCLTKFCETRSRGCVLRMPCGFGKTVCALYLISQRRRRTLYIVQADNLFQQTVLSIRRLLPRARIGTIQGPTKTWITDGDVVVAMMQTLYAHRDQLKTPLTWSFGLIVVDECHHLGAPTFCAVLQKFAPSYFLGLTATPQRMDGKSKWIEWMMGPIVDVFEKDELKRRDIEVVWSPPLQSSFPPDHLVFVRNPTKDEKGSLKYLNVIKLSLFMWDADRRQSQTQHIFQHAISDLQWTNPREPQVVVFAARIFQLCLLSYALQKQYVLSKVQAHLKNVPAEMCAILAESIFYHDGMESSLQQTFANNIRSVSDYYRFSRNKARTDRVDETQHSYLAYVQTLQIENEWNGGENWMFPMCIATTSSKKTYRELDRVVLFATVQKLGEGVDITTLHTVCLASSISAQNLPQLEQVIGRLRKKEGDTKGSFVVKRILDFGDDVFKNQMKARKKFYDSRGIRQVQIQM